MTIFHTKPYDIFIEIKDNLKNKNLHRINQGTNRTPNLI